MRSTFCKLFQHCVSRTTAIPGQIPEDFHDTVLVKKVRNLLRRCRWCSIWPYVFDARSGWRYFWHILQYIPKNSVLEDPKLAHVHFAHIARWFLRVYSKYPVWKNTSSYAQSLFYSVNRTQAGVSEKLTERAALALISSFKSELSSIPRTSDFSNILQTSS